MMKIHEWIIHLGRLTQKGHVSQAAKSNMLPFGEPLLHCHKWSNWSYFGYLNYLL